MSTEELSLLQTISSWPTLHDNEFFIEQRDLTLLTHLRKCFKELENSKTPKKCLQFAHEWMTTFNINKISKKEMGDLLFPYLSKENLWPYYETLAKDPLGEFYCYKSPMNEVVIENLFLHLGKKELQIDVSCFKSLIPQIETLLTSRDSLTLKNAHTLLEKYKGLNAFSQNLATMVDFLNGNQTYFPVKTQWDLLKNLANDHSLRQKILDSLKRIDPLPDGLFHDYQNKRLIVRAKTLMENFPEYVDYYAHTCLQYLEGKGKFPKGNPTLNCHNFFKMNKAYPLVPVLISKKYQKLTSFIQ